MASEATLARITPDFFAEHDIPDSAQLLDDLLPAHGALLIVSGRTSFEIIQKALAAGLAGVIGVSAPSSLAVSTAARFGLLLCGFARSATFNIYAGAHRLHPD